MRNIIIGVIVGLLVGGGIAWAAVSITLRNGQDIEVGTSANPIYIHSI
jgi:hypothetical protein